MSNTNLTHIPSSKITEESLFYWNLLPPVLNSASRQSASQIYPEMQHTLPKHPFSYHWKYENASGESRSTPTGH